MLIDVVKNDIRAAFAEDLGDADISAELIPAGQSAQAKIICREPMLVCGQDWVNEAFRLLDPEIEITWLVTEGQYLNEPATLCLLKGNARAILSAERTALNFLQTLSATATQTRRYVEQLHGTSTRLLDTRKTLPGLRRAQKYAVCCGGGENHRMGLYDAYLIKENHIKACGSIRQAVERARSLHPEVMVEVEVESLEELTEALSTDVDRIMLDNFNEAMLNDAVKMNQQRQVELEVSGGIGLDNLAKIAKTGVDYVSVGAITKSIQAIDLSLIIDA